MSIPDVTVSVLDGQLGFLPENIDNLVAKVGMCSVGTKNTIYSITTFDQVRTQLGTGPLAEAVALHLNDSGGPVLAIPTEQATAGSVAAVVKLPAETTGTVAITGTPKDSYELVILIVVGGSVATATFKYSLDGGTTWSPETTTAATVVLSPSNITGGTGLTAAFTAADPVVFVAGATFSFACTGPVTDTGKLGSALDALINSAYDAALVHVVGVPGGNDDAAKATAGAGIFAAVATKIEGAVSKAKWMRAVVDVPDIADAAIMTGYASTTSTRVAAVAGWVEYISPLTGLSLRRSAGWIATSKLGKKPIGKDSAELNVGDGIGPVSAAVTAICRDEAVTPALDAVGFTTLRTVVGRTGFYVTNFRLKSPSGSDFKYLHLGQIIDKACRITRDVLLSYLSRPLRTVTVSPTVATLDKAEAATIDADLSSSLAAGLVAPKHAQAAEGVTDTVNDVVSSETLRAEVTVKPFFYPKTITATVALRK